MKHPPFPARKGVLFSFFLPVLIAVLAGTVHAQTYDFVGLVQDGQRGEAIGNAELTTPEGKRLGVSQSTGRFEVQVNNRRAHVIFKKQGYKDLDIDLGELPNLIDVEISMESNVQELAEVTTFTKRPNHDPNQAQSIDELESLQGMRIDLNDHLRQLHGVAGMNEYTNDISVNGSRTQDVTHYLGHSHIPSLRHLDFGFPGNQSLLNPRLLKSVTLSDNMAKGPVNQGNASALVYDLKDGDPEAIHGDLLIGSVDDELNMNGYWGGRTLLLSLRRLDDNALGNLGSKFFTSPKDAKVKSNGNPCDTCAHLNAPLTFTSGDLFFSTFKRDSTGAFSRHSLIVLSDDFFIQQDVGTSTTSAIARDIVDGHQGAWLYSYESVSPSSSGDWEWGFSTLIRDYEDAFADTLPQALNNDLSVPAWYRAGNGNNDVTYRLGDNSQKDWQSIWSGQWSPSAKTFGAQTSYALELEYHHQHRIFPDQPTTSNLDRNLSRDLGLTNMLYRLRWNLPKKRGLDASLGMALGYQGQSDGLSSPFSADQAGLLTPLPLASLRYTNPLGEDHKVFSEIAVRQTTDFKPVGYDTLRAKSTPSAEALIGGDGAIGNPMRYAWSGYTRVYLNPNLPTPDVFWNYAEQRSSDYARVSGINASFNWLPSHHVGIGINGSSIQGTYHMKDGLGSLPWESNRTADVVTNLRLLPRDDSLLSFIFTYTVSNGRPLYEYRGLWDTTGADHVSKQRSVYQSSTFPEVSRKRLDMRINIDLKSSWRPLESMRFFFEMDNIGSAYEGTLGNWLGGDNKRQRGWSRPAAGNGDLQPVVTKGLGFFIMFGLEGHLKI